MIIIEFYTEDEHWRIHTVTSCKDVKHSDILPMMPKLICDILCVVDS